MTIGQVKEGAGAILSCAQKFLPYINDTCTTYQINTPARQLCFLAQVGHESGGLYYTEELASGAAYEGRASLGNTHPGDGVKFKGRGLIQITGRTNYQALSTVWKVDLLDNPTMLGGKNAEVCNDVQLKYASLSAGWFWNANKLNLLADKIDLKSPIDEGTNLDTFKLITRRINGGYNGLPDRLHRFKVGVQYFVDIPPA